MLDDDTLSEDDQNIINNACTKIFEAIEGLQPKDEKVSSDIPSSSSSSESSDNASDTDSIGNSSSSDKSGSSDKTSSSGKSKSADNDNIKAKVAKTGDGTYILLLAMTTLCLSMIVIYKRKKANK